MSEPFIGEIQIFGFNFAPRGWSFCAGNILPISQNTALFSLLGTTYGGNGTTTFQLPNLDDRTVCHRGQGPGMAPRQMGEPFGSDAVTLTVEQMPAHAHAMRLVMQDDASKRTGTPAAGNWLTTPGETTPFAPDTQPDKPFAPDVIGVAGGSQPHENRQPYLAVNFCIALQGIFPSFD
ncbi:MAG: phage tail protein [Lysobacter sp.]